MARADDAYRALAFRERTLARLTREARRGDTANLYLLLADLRELAAEVMPEKLARLERSA